MAVIGDVLVKLVADFGQFAEGLKQSQAALKKFGETGESIAKSIGEIEKAVKASAFVYLATEAYKAVKAVVDFNNEMQKHGERLAAYALTVDSTARSTRGLTEESLQLATMYKTMGREWTDDYLARVRKAQTQTEEFATKSSVVGQHLHAIYLQLTQRPGDSGGWMDAMADKANELLTWFEKLVPSINHVVDIIAKGLVIQFQLAVLGARTLIDASIDLVTWLAKVASAATVSGSALEKMAREQARARGYNIPEPPPGPTGAGGALGLFQTPGGTAAAAAAARNYAETQAALGRGFGSIFALPGSLAADAYPTPTATKGGGGGGRDDDTIDRQIKRVQDLAAAAQKSMEIVRTSVDQTVDSLQRQENVQQSINEAVTAFIRRYPQATKAQTEAYTVAVTAQKQLEDERAQFLKDSQAAEQIERRLGDGTLDQRRRMEELTKAYNTSRLSVEAYNRALRQNNEATRQASLEARRYDDDLGSIAAGFEHAANAYARSNDLYTMGEQAFTGLTTAMGQGLDALAGKSDKTFGQIAADFAKMLADMALRAAVSQVFRWAFGAVTGDITAIPVAPGGFSASVDPVTGMGNIIPRQHGGPVSAGRPYLVGEAGPEMFVPRAAGHIVPNGGGGGDVTVNIDMKQAEGARDPSSALEFGRRVRSAVVDVIQNEKRPGGTLFAR